MKPLRVDLLRETKHTDQDVETFLHQVCDTLPQAIIKVSNDTRAWFAESGGQPYFVKWVESASFETLLARDAAICAQNLHPSIVTLWNKIRTRDGVLLVFEKIAGETLADTEHRARFFALPLAVKLYALHALYGALAAIADAGWVSRDFYEGNVIYNYATGKITLFDFELFEPGTGYTLDMDSNYGSSRLMAPEDFVRGSWIDQTTNVYTLGRYAINALSPRIDASWRTEFPANARLADILERATQPDRSLRYPTVSAFVQAFMRE